MQLDKLTWVVLTEGKAIWNLFNFFSIWSISFLKWLWLWPSLPNSTNSDGFTPLDISLMLLNMPLIKYLQSCGGREGDCCKYCSRTLLSNWMLARNMHYLRYCRYHCRAVHIEKSHKNLSATRTFDKTDSIITRRHRTKPSKQTYIYFHW